MHEKELGNVKGVVSPTEPPPTEKSGPKSQDQKVRTVKSEKSGPKSQGSFCGCKCQRIAPSVLAPTLPPSEPDPPSGDLTPPQVDLHPPPAQRSGCEDLGGGTYTPPQLRAYQILLI